eukprot:10975438-Lingulodinium_polyedra.AAC.1
MEQSDMFDASRGKKTKKCRKQSPDALVAKAFKDNVKGWGATATDLVNRDGKRLCQVRVEAKHAQLD